MWNLFFRRYLVAFCLLGLSFNLQNHYSQKQERTDIEERNAEREALQSEQASVLEEQNSEREALQSEKISLSEK